MPVSDDDDLRAGPAMPSERVLRGGPGEDLVATAERRQPVLALFEQQYHQVVAFVRVCGASDQDAQDAAQEAFIEALRRADDGQWPLVSNPAGWLRRVAYYRYRRMIRRGRAQWQPLTPDDDQLPSPGPGPSDLAPETIDTLAALSRLPPECRAVLAFHLDGFTSVEAAALLDITPQHARDLLKRPASSWNAISEHERRTDEHS